MLDIEQIKNRLSNHNPQLQQEQMQRQAAVAMLLYAGAQGLELLFIRRAEYAGDPWSGDVAFPGGSIESQDRGPRQAAERETQEEIGLHLEAHHYLGRLDDLSGAYLSVQISCFVYQLEEKPELKLNGEVVDAFWVPLTELQNPARCRETSFEYRGSRHTHPIIELDGYSERFLWGISYRLLNSFFILFEKSN